MNPKFFIIDAFTDTPFTGNPAGVVLTEDPLTDHFMQKLANEIGLSETAFISSLRAETVQIRWFTPTVEAPLCGHATLAAAHALWSEHIRNRNSPLRFLSSSGPLTARQSPSGIELDFPSEPMTPLSVVPAILEQEFGSLIQVVGKNRLDYFVELDHETSVKSYQPNMEKLLQLGRGLIITAPSNDPHFDFVSRVFAPSEGIPEDPVTGSAHCCLAPYWSQKLGKLEMLGRQLSQREGQIKVFYEGTRTRLTGHAVTIVSGTIQAELKR